MGPQSTRVLALTILTMVCAGGCGAADGASANDPGGAKVSVSIDATQGQIDHVTLTISQGPTVAGNVTPMSETVLELTRSAGARNQWTASLGDIPAGSARLFRVSAYRAAGSSPADLAYQGEAVAGVTARGTATVVILLQETGAQPALTRAGPRLTSLTVGDSYVLPGTIVPIHVTAVDPDGQGDPLEYQLSSSCDAGSGSFSSSAGQGAAFDTSFLAPSVNATCQLTLLVRESATAGNQSSPLSVSTYFTIAVNSSFGRAVAEAFPNSSPIVSVAASFRYNYFPDVTTLPVGQQADFQFTAVDPDGDNVRYHVSARCGADLATAAAQPDLPGDYFYYQDGWRYVGKASGGDGTTFTTTGTTGVALASPYTSQWSLHFGGTSDGLTLSDPTRDCIFTVTAQDLCTAGDCGVGQGALPDGAVKQTIVAGVTVESLTTGVIEAVHPARPARAPVISGVIAPNQDGPAVAGAQGWDPPRAAVLAPNRSYTLQVSADDRWEDTSHPPAIAWSCDTGAASAPIDVVSASLLDPTVRSVTSSISLATGAALSPGRCTATAASTRSGLSTVVTFTLR
jgi:hypothetical protein